MLQQKCEVVFLIFLVIFTANLTSAGEEGSEKLSKYKVVTTKHKNCREDEFLCKYSQQCVKKEFLCDGIFDCGLIGNFNLLDDSDENQNCTKICEPNQLLCSNNVCLEIDKFCDGNKDCQNDELNCKNQSLCQNLKCDYDCKVTPYGPKCYCPSGQQIVNDTKCVDLDECLQKDEVCDQICENLINTYKCSCGTGYEWKNKRCMGINDPPANSTSFLIMRSTEMVQFTLSTEFYNQDDHILLTRINQNGMLSNALDMEINFDNSSVCVLSIGLIDCFNLSNFKDKWTLPKPIIFPNLEGVTRFLFDWVSKNWYFMNTGNNMIFVCSYKMEYCKIIVENPTGIDSFRRFVIDPNVGYLFVTRFGLFQATGAIMRYSLDGRKETSLITTKIFYPNFITLDLAKMQIYFLDNFYSFIQQCDYNGNNRKFLQKLPEMKLNSVGFFENYFYGMTEKHNSLVQIDKTSSQKKMIILDDSDKNNSLLKIIHRQIQPLKNTICKTHDCDHICVPFSSNQNKCVCSEGFELSENKCIQTVPSKFLIYVKDNPKMIKGISLDGKFNKSVITPVTNIDSPKVDVNIEDKLIYFSTIDNNKKFKIESQFFNGTNRTILLDNLNSVKSMAYDSFGKNLFFITEIDNEFRIAAIRAKIGPGSKASVKTLIKNNLSNPISIILNVADGMMFWSSWPSKFSDGGSIESAWMDGTNRQVLVKTDNNTGPIYWPMSLTLDKENNHLFWLDVLTQTVEYIELSNSNVRKKLLSASASLSPFFPSSISYFNSSIYWSDHIKSDIRTILISNRTSESDLNNSEVFLKDFGKITEIMIIDSVAIKTSSKIPSTPCPGLWLTNKMNLPICVCPDYSSLNAAGTQCIPSTNKNTGKEKMTVKCEDGKFRCASGTECIKLEKFCDGRVDCSDGSDEIEENCIKRCDFRCDDKSRCLSKSQLCDQTVDCVDETDENTELCQNKTSICQEGNCHSDYCDEFICANGNCIDFFLQCDSEDNCGDNSDELNCPNITSTTVTPNTDEEISGKPDHTEDFTYEFGVNDNDCQYPNLYCIQTKKCISHHLLCNGIVDCPGGLDENGRCEEKLCDRSTECQYFCHNAPHEDGYVCYCPSHMVLELNRKNCGLPRECDSFSSCSHICENVNSTKIKCRCLNGYKLASDGFSCVEVNSDDPIILYSNKFVIKGVNARTLSLRNYYSLSKQVIGLDFFYDQESKHYEVYWSDVSEDKIYMGIVKNSELFNVQTIVESGLSTTEAVAIDWIGENLYWVDSTLRQIEVSKKTGEFRKTLISENMSNPRSIAVDPRIGYLFWSDWDANNPRIERSTLSGEERKAILVINNSKGSWPNGITLDYVKKRIFFLDAKSKEIHTIDYNGNDDRRILKNQQYLSHPFAISIFDNHMYWTDWRMSGVMKADKFSGTNITMISHTQSQPFEIKIMHPSRQPRSDGFSKNKINPCSVNSTNGGCSHLCLLSVNDTFKCDCPHMMRLSTDGKTCENINNMLLFISGADEIKGVGIFASSDPVPIISTIKHATEIIAPTHLDYDPSNNRIYWTDTRFNGVKAVQLSTTSKPSRQKIETIIDSSFENVVGFSIDWINELLFYVQVKPDKVSEDQKTKKFNSHRIMISNLKGEFMSVLLDDLNEIYSFMVSSEWSEMFYVMLTLQDETEYFSIIQCNLDGSEQKTIISEDEIVHSLSLNFENRRLYFIKNYQKLFYFDFNTKKTELVNLFYGKDDKYSNMYVSCLVAFKDKIYYGENYTNTIQSCQSEKCQVPETFKNNTSNLKQMKIVSLSTELTKKIPSKHYCNHLYIPTPGSEEGFVCLCSMGYRKDEKNPHQCIGYDNFLLYSVGHELQGISLNGSETNHEYLTPLQKIHEISSIDFDVKNDYFYIADSESGEILRIKKDSSEKLSLLTSIDNLENNHGDWLSDVAVDWLAENVYWTDQKRGLIEVARTNGAYRYVITSQINRPYLITLDPVVGVLFFVDGDYKIIRQNLDGGNFKFHVNKYIENNTIFSIILDTNNQLVYWCESKTSKIWRADYDGNDRKQLEISGATNPISMDIYNGRMYWVEKGNGIIKSVNLKNLNESIIVKNSTDINVKHVKVFSSEKQRGTNLCAMPKYGDCEELCLFNGTHGVCHCSQGIIDPTNGKRCKNYTNFMFYSRMDTIEKMIVSNSDNLANDFNISKQNSFRSIIALTYNYGEKTLYFSDIEQNAIYSCDFQGNSLRKIVENQSSVEGIAFHSQANELFWTIEGSAEVRSVNLNILSENTTTTDVTQFIKVLLKLKKNEDKLRAIAVEPCLNMFYFSNWNFKKPSIQRAYITGFGREDVIRSNIMMPNALTFDYVERKLFWADARLDKIEYCNYDGNGRTILAHSSPKHPFSIAVFGEFIFWTDWILHGVMRTNKYSANDVTFLRRNVQKPMGIVVVQETPRECTSSHCTLFNGGCEDVCLPHGIDGFKCECSQGLLDKSGKRCIGRKKEAECNSTTEFECKSGECIPLLITCDGNKHCVDGSDEDLNYCATRNCTSDEYFQCRNFRCIERQLVCNSHHDCPDGSDEENCECKDDEFRCGSGECISVKLRCDHDPDCRDNSDEMNCAKRDCSLDKSMSYGLHIHINNSEYLNFEQCPHTTACILKSWICDGENDCWDNWDERNCDDKKTNISCSENQFQCLNGNCIPLEWVCDEEPDCNDGTVYENGTYSLSSDELDCMKFCKKNQFKCANSSMCIPIAFVCDSLFDCPDKSDESSDCPSKAYDITDDSDDCADPFNDDGNCNTSQYNVDKFNCSEEQFTCDNRDCIDIRLICDLKPDCSDGSDETVELCKDNVLYCEKNPKKFRCSGGSCIDIDLVCNDMNDCGDFSDEKQCNINECEFAECEHICEDLKIGYRCSCRQGFELNDRNKCEDIDECLTRPCSQMCLNTFGSYKCQCYEGFIKVNNSCKADTPERPKILFSNRYYIREVDFHGNTNLLIHNLSNAVALDYDWNNKFIYFSDVTATKSEIVRIKLNDDLNSNKKEVLHHHNLKNPDGLAFDWVAKNLYFCDKGRHTIEVSTDSGRYRKVLIDSKLDEPRAIVLDPYEKNVYWSDWGKIPHIGKAGMDGSNPRYIVNDTNMVWPNALTISFETNELYYGDAREDFIAVCDLNGNNKKIIASRATNPSLNLHHIFSIAVWEDRIFWSDWELKSIEYCDKFSAKTCGTLVQMIHRPVDIRLYHSLRQTKLRIPFRKKSNETKKIENKKKTDLYNFIDDNPCFNSSCAALCLLKPEPPFYVCACPENFTLNADGKSCTPNCSASHFLCEKSMKCIPFYFECDGMPDCVTADGTIEDESDACPQNRHCQPGYFQCSSNSTSVNGTCLRPHLICDGIKQCENGDDEKNCDNFDCIVESQFKCEKTDNSSAFCIDNVKRCNDHIDCPSGNDEKDCPPKTCAPNQFKCKSDGSCVANVWMCDGDVDCPDGSDESDEICAKRVCNVNEFRCSSGRCIPLSWKCDGENDCGVAGEDEGPNANCDAVVNNCDPSYFRCNSSKCIPGRWRCDYERDCDDGSDEIGCTARNCSESEFRCDDGRCIKGSLRCNGEYNCKDFSDEFNCTIKCDENSFKCENQNVCINKKFLCDGDGDCADFSDEKNCGCNAHEFKCGGVIEKCILTEFLCDGIIDCPGGTDEQDSRCLSRSCSGNAVKCDNGKCIPRWFLCNNEDNCGDGFDELKCDTKKSASVNLKSVCKFGNCSQICLEKSKVNTNSFQCKCATGYHKSSISKSSSCRAITGVPMIFSASESELRFLIEFEKNDKEIEKKMDSKEIQSNLFYTFIQTESLKITSFDYLLNEDNLTFFWLESLPTNYMYSVNLSAKLDLTNIKENGFHISDVKLLNKNKPKESIYKSLALDWLNSKIYLIENDMIRAFNFDGEEKKTILDAGRNSWDLIVDPISRQIIWSTMLRIIYIASMDGTNKKILIIDNVEFASGLAIDQPSRRLYWCDIRKSTIESTLLDGTDRHIIRKYNSLDSYGLPIGPFKLDVFEDEMYVVFSNQTIYKMNKFGKMSEDQEIFNGAYVHKSSHIKVVHELLRSNTIVNPCQTNPCDPSALCLLSSVNPLGRTCSCPDNMFLQISGDDVTCLEKFELPELCVRNCFNNGYCQFINKKQTCVCPPKYDGDQCEHYICNGYCLNEGVCLLPSDKVLNNLSSEEARNHRRCKCKSEWTGERCSIPVKLCQNECHNGGTCHYTKLNDGTIRENCICPLNFSGSKCENCASLQCFNGGICRETDSSNFVCDCNVRYTGRHCEIDKCEGYCKYGGICSTDQVKGPMCSCVSNYSGDRCEIDNICKDYCLNGGSCVRLANAPFCHCPDQYTGLRCQKLSCEYNQGSDECMNAKNTSNLCHENIRCENNGICKINSDGKPICMCVGEWTGPYCTIPPLCVNDECGKCNEQSSVNECTCKNGLIQPCLISEVYPHDGSVSSTEIVNTSHESISIVMILIFVLCLLSTLVLVMGVYIKRWLQRNRFFTHARLNENVEEITNPIFDYSATEVEDTAVLSASCTSLSTFNESKAHFSNPIYESMYASYSNSKGLLDKNDDDEEIKKDLL